MGVKVTELLNGLDVITFRFLDAIREKTSTFIHGNFTLAAFLSKTFHLFIILGFCGALIGYMNGLIVKDSPIYSLNGTMSNEVATISFLNATLSVQKPLILTPMQQTDLIFGTIVAIMLFIVVALTILWEAMNFHEDRPTTKVASEYNLLIRVLFITLFGSLALVFLSYMIRNFGVFLQGLLEALSIFAAIYLFFITVKKSENIWRWSVLYMAIALLFIVFQLRVPVLSIFTLFLGGISVVYIILYLPFKILMTGLHLAGVKKK